MTAIPVTPDSQRRPAVAFIFITLVLDVLGFGLIIPVSPQLVQNLLGRAEGAEASIAQTAPFVGYLAATYAAMSFLCAPSLGALSDRFGRRPVILISLFGSAVDYVAMSFSPTLWFLFLTRAINGVSGGSITVAMAYIADITPPEKRAAAFGMIGAAFGVGFTLGPMMGGFLGSFDIHYPFYAAAGLTFANWVYGYFVLPESLPVGRRAAFRWSRSNPVGAFVGLGRNALVGGLASAMFLVNLAHYGLRSTWVLYTAYRYEWDPLHVAYSLGAVGVGAMIVQGGLVRRIVPALGEKWSLTLGLAITVASFVGYGVAWEGWMIYVVIAFGSLGGIAGPSIQSLITRTVRADEQGLTQGALTSLESVAAILGPLIGASVFAYFISDSAPVDIPGASFFVGAALAALAWLVAVWAMTRTTIGEAPDSPGPSAAPAPSTSE